MDIRKEAEKYSDNRHFITIWEASYRSFINGAERILQFQNIKTLDISSGKSEDVIFKDSCERIFRGYLSNNEVWEYNGFPVDNKTGSSYVKAEVDLNTLTWIPLKIEA